MRGRYSFGDDHRGAEREAPDLNLMLAAARVRRERIQSAETWTFITVACFLLWTAAVLLGA
jgi:hypothetical protein